MRVAVIGSRSFSDYKKLCKVLDEYLINEIVSGAALGTDRLARMYATNKCIKLTEYIPDWELHGKSAGAIRNKQIVDHCHEVIAFWDGESKGTKISIDYARKQGKKVTIINF